MCCASKSLTLYVVIILKQTPSKLWYLRGEMITNIVGPAAYAIQS